MKEYIVKRINEDTIGINSPVWDSIESADIDYFPWRGYAENIKTSVKLVHSDYGITVHFKTDEKPLVTKNTEDNSEVYEDSCMEFFFRTSSSDAYMNLETNPNGAVLSGFGKDKATRNRIGIKKELFFITSEINDESWILQYTVPYSFIEEYFGEFQNEMYANFYKCGDKTGHEHYACWNPIEIETPNFHVPEFFGKLILE